MSDIMELADTTQLEIVDTGYADLDIPDADDCIYVANQYRSGYEFAMQFFFTLRDLMLAGFCCLFMLGCGSTETVSPEIAEQAAELAAGASYEKAIDAHAKTIATALAAQKLTGEMTLENTQAIMAKLNTLEASLIVPKAEPGKEVIKSAPNPPAKANTALAPLKVATPGDSSETLTELATRLYSQGVSVHMKTEDELKAIDAQMQGVKSSPVQYQPRSTYSVQSGCPGGVCPVPQRVSRRGKK